MKGKIALKLTNPELAAYALAQLGGLEQPVHLEEIAELAFKFAPGAFRWDLPKFSHYVDKYKVRVSLFDAQKPPHGFVENILAPTNRGRPKRTDYWRLTSDGAAWTLANQSRITAILAGPTPRLRRRVAQPLRARLQGNPLYEEYGRRGTVSSDPFAFADLVEVSPDAAVGVVRRRYDELKGQVVLLDDPELFQFLEAVASAHQDMLGATTK